MMFSANLLYTLIVCAIWVGSRSEKFEELVDPENDEFIGLELTPAQALRARGFIAREYHMRTRDGYVLRLTQGLNPLIDHEKFPKKDPIVFLHGACTSPSIFLLNSARVRPMDFSEIFASGAGKEEWLDLVGDEPSSKSLPFLALNFGHQVWIISRRGFVGSENKAGHLNRTEKQVLAAIPETMLNTIFRKPADLTAAEAGFNETLNNNRTDGRESDSARAKSLLKSLAEVLKNFTELNLSSLRNAIENQRADFVHTFDPDYWRFSMDEQATIDLPQCVKFVLAKTGRKKLSIVAYSAGGAISLMALSEMPKFFDKRVSKVILWSPAINLGSKTDIVNQLSILGPIIEPNYKGPLFFVFAIERIKRFLMDLCNKDVLLQYAICSLWMIAGPVDKYSYYKSFQFSGFPEATSTLELNQLIQYVGKFKPRKYNFDTVEENLAAYGQTTPPAYELARISHKHIDIFVGNSDALVSPEDVGVTSSQLRTPHNVTIIRGEDIKFNHFGYFVHDFVGRLVNIPSLWEIEN